MQYNYFQLGWRKEVVCSFASLQDRKQSTKGIVQFQQLLQNLVGTLYSIQMSKRGKKVVENRETQKSMSKSKLKANEQSTTIHQSQSTTLNTIQRLNPVFKSSSHCKFYGCCNSIKSKELKFQPEVHDVPFQIYPTNCNTLSRSKKQQWEGLIQDNRSKLMERTEAKLREEESRMVECTFYPTITQFQAVSKRDSENIYQKLYEEAEQRKTEQLKAEKQRIQKERSEIEEYQNKKPDPQKWKSLNRQKFDLEPLYKRLEKVIEQKKKGKKMIAEKQQINYPFHPEVNETSKKIIQRKGIIENVVDRLIDEYKKKETRINTLRETLQLNFKKQFTFTPAVNNFFPAENIKVHRQNKQNSENSFKPSINPLSSLMMQDRENQTNEQKIYRLYNASIIKKADRMTHIEAEAYAECYFNPQINEISKQMKSNGHKHHLCEVKQPESPTHRPEINEVSRLMSETKRARSLDNIKKKTKQKEASYKKQMEYIQMKECSFKPKIKDNKNQRKVIKNQMNIQDVAGFKRYYEKVEKTQQRQRERREIQERLFHLQKSYDLRMLKLSEQANMGVQGHN